MSLSGAAIESLAQEIGSMAQTLRNWISKTQAKSGLGIGKPNAVYFLMRI